MNIILDCEVKIRKLQITIVAATEVVQTNEAVTKNHSHRSLYWDDKVSCSAFQEIDHLGKANVLCTDTTAVLTAI